MTQEEKRHLLKIDICGRLPYGMKFYDETYLDTPKIEAYCSNDYAEWASGEIGGFSTIGRIFVPLGDAPLLRPIEDLCSEITHAGYNDGQPFVPIVECAKISQQIFEEYTLSKDDWGDVDMPDFGMQYNLKYIVEASNMGNLEYQFSYWTGLRRFSLIDITRNISLALTYEVDLFDLMNRLMIDYRGLIPAGLAKSVHDLDKNPYE